MVAVRSVRRLAWVVDQLDLRPSDHVLEVGCGHGVAAELVVHGLTTGSYTGVDRSSPMIDATAARLARSTHDGRFQLVHGALDSVDLPGRSFDRIFAANVAAMARPEEVERAAGLLAPGGVLVVSHESPDPGRTRALAAETVESLRATDLGPPATRSITLGSSLVACVVATRC